ncbi:MAG: hypothetical protein Tsb0020_09230 [Haliangiales bacterium]
MIRRILCVMVAFGLPLAACNSSEFESPASPPSATKSTDTGQSKISRVDLRHAPTLWQQVAREGLSNKALGAGDEVGFRTLRHTTSANGLLHTRTQQTYKGVPIWGEHVITSRDPRGQVVRMHGNLIQGIERLDTTPAFSERDALDNMKALHALDFTGGERRFENESSELVVFAQKGAPKLAYAVSFFSDVRGGGEPSRPTFLVDAKSGEVLLHFEGLTTDAIGTGPGGNSKVGQYEYGTDFGFNDVAVSGSTCTMNNANVKTVNLNHGTSGSTAYSYTCPRNTVKTINGAFSPLNDAHFFGGQVFDMYQAWVGTAPLTFQLTMRVHYSSSYENAFWNGSAMTFGDGGSTFHPLVSLDVSSHEVSHGFTEQNSGLIYSGQSGGINEAFSDIAGEAAENFMHGTNDFLVGADIFKADGALRYMADPPLDGSSIGHADDYTNGMDVHYSSGVYNKAFYLMATSPGWDVQKAFTLFAHANQNYWTPSATYLTAADGVRDSATDLGFDLATVNDAFDAVGVIPPLPPEPSCTDPANCVDVTLDLLTDDYASETSWRISRGGATVASGSGYSNNTNYIEVTPLDPGDYVFTISDSFGDGICCGYGLGAYELSSPSGVIVSGGAFGSSESTAFTITGDDPPANQAPTASFSATTNNLSASFTDGSADSDGSVASWAWDFGDGSTSAQQDPSHTYGAAGTYTVTLTVTDDDGASDSASQSVTVTDAPGGFVELSNDNFESGMQGWIDGGSDVRRSANDAAYASEGTFCVRLRDNSGAASAMSKAYDLSGFSDLRVSFSYYARSMETNEDFFVEVWDGSSWNVVANYVVGVDFSNDTFNTASVTVDASGLGADSGVRIRADASGNSDYIYVDEVVVEAQ